MALDASMLRCLCSELDELLTGMRIMKVTMPSRDEVILNLRSQDSQAKLLISTRAGSARLQITEENFDNPAVPPSFCMLLRKHIGGGKITKIECLDSERVAYIHIDAVDEMGDLVHPMLSVELMGRYSNIVIVSDKGIVIDAIKRINDSMSDIRQLMPGFIFTAPPAQINKLPFFSTSTSVLAERALRESKPLSSALLSTVAGIGPTVCREISFRTCENDKDADMLTADEKALLYSNIEYVKHAVDCDRHYCIIKSDHRLVEFSYMDLQQYGELDVIHFDTASEMLNLFYSERDREERRKAKSHNLKHQVTTILERTVRRNAAREAEYYSADKADSKKLYGELLTANLWKIKKGDKAVTVENYYDGKDITILLDPMLTPNGNAQKYYKEYRKLTNAHKILEKLLIDGKNEEEYLRSVLYEIENAETEEDFTSIREELKNSGYLKAYKVKPQKSRKVTEFLKYRSSEGIEILAGRSNTANDKLSLHTADKHDIWFHVKNAPGAHVVLRLKGSIPSDKDLEEAAEIAAYHSSVNGDNIEVDYTEIKNVHKESGAKAGMVIYKGQTTVVVTPSEEKIEKLKA